MHKKALITGINGQDGSYLSEFLLSKDYDVYGFVKKFSYSSCCENMSKKVSRNIIYYYGDMIDEKSLFHCVSDILPDEIYNLAGQSQVSVSFVYPAYTEKVNSLGCLRLLGAIKKFKPTCKFYQACSSEIYGNEMEGVITESSLFCPSSPYASSKLAAYWYVRYFREIYNIFSVNGILFNHESPKRSENFVSKKIIKQVCEIARGERKTIFLGNMSGRRDWGFAGDYIKAMWLMLQANKPDDYIIATGKSYSVEDFCNIAFSYFGIELEWSNNGINRVAIDKKNKEIRVAVDEKFYRFSDNKNLVGNCSKATKRLGWKPTFDLYDLIIEMINWEQTHYEENIV